MEKHREKCWWGMEGNDQCPVLPIHDKLEEAHWFYHAMIRDYHTPFLFRYQLSAFLTALKSFFEFIPAQANSLNDKKMREFYKEEKKNLEASNSIVKELFNIRNTTVHRNTLKKNTRVTVGRFKPSKGFKQALDMEVNPFLPSDEILENYLKQMNEFTLLKPEIDSGEILALERIWKLSESGLDKKEISEYCAEGLDYMFEVNKRLHNLYGIEFIIPNDCKHHINDVKLIEYVDDSWFDEEDD